MATWFVTDSGTFICKDAVQFISSSYYSTNWWSRGHQSDLGHVKDSSPNQLIVCHMVLWWVCGAHCIKYSYLFRCPLWVTNSSNIISNWSGWIQYLLLIWRTIFVIPFIFFFCTFGSDRHVIVVLDSAFSDLESCLVHCQWGQIAILGWSYLCYHCHILCCYLHNYIIFLVYKIYKIKNITIFIFNPIFLIRQKLVSKFQYHFPKHFGGVGVLCKLIIKLIVGVILLSATVCVCDFSMSVNVSSQYVQILFYNFIIVLGWFSFYFLSNSSMFIFFVLCC